MHQAKKMTINNHSQIYISMLLTPHAYQYPYKQAPPPSIAPTRSLIHFSLAISARHLLTR